MNRTLATAALAALAVAGLAACSPKAAPTAAPATTAASPSAAAPSASASPSAPPSAGTSPVPSPPPPPAKPVALGPTGYGPLKIGLTPAQAYATGIITKPTAGNGASPGCDQSAGLAGSGYKVGGDSVAGWVLFGPHGVAAIYAYGKMATPEGIRLGSTTAQVTRAYPKGVIAEGRMNVAADATGKTEYRIALSGGKVIQLALQNRPNGCYE
ncbi:hypothetical protein [Hamadaea tsunoensis]|uniref:hypothetical protein n=1 Tax=Hamadaea tsunoensis TaxID=53368 RepID=UPI0004053C83|nr:hypothetical protein [Hamadaea tsunoensis]